MSLAIRVDSPIVILGDPESPSQLRGTVVLELKEPMRLKAVKLVLVGRARLQWRNNAIKRTILSREWTFLPPTCASHPLLLPAGEHMWPFEATLDGHLPESVQGSSYGEIEYHLKAEGVRPIVKNLVCRVPLEVWREPRVPQRPVRGVGHETDVITYECVARKAVYGRGGKVLVDVYAGEEQNNWHVRSITTVFKEMIKLPSSSSSTTTTDEVRVLRFMREQEPFEHASSTVLMVRIPRFAQFDATNTLFSIRHQIELTVALEQNSLKKECRVRLPVVVAQDELVRAIVNDNEWLYLPSYADALMSPEFNTSSGVATPADELDHWLPFGCDNHPLIRLPSYNEAVTGSAAATATAYT